MTRIVVTDSGDTTDPDDGRLTLREAVALAEATEGADRIVFAKAVSRVTLERSLTIEDGSALVIEGDRNRDGLADVTMSASDSFSGGSLLHNDGTDLRIDSVNFGGFDITRSDGFNSIFAGTTGGNGGSFATIYNDSLARLTLSGVEFADISITAGNGGSGGAGANGTAGTSFGTADNGMNGRSGGSGQSGTGGGNGGAGGMAVGAVWNDASAILKVLNVAVTPDVSVSAGDGGAGARGGTGGSGGRGQNGGDGVAFGAFPGDLLPGNGGNGGAGGRGGSGGPGGPGGDATAGIYNEGTLAIRTGLGGAGATADAGSGGCGGSGGSGGRGGAGGSGGSLFLYPDGAPGRTGSTGSNGSTGSTGIAGDADALLLTDGSETARVFDTLVFAHASQTAAREGGSLIFTVVRLGSSDTNFTVDWKIGGGPGIEGSDLDGSDLSGEVEFTAGGADVRRVKVDLARDGHTEGDETLVFRLGEANFTSTTDKTVGFGTVRALSTIRDADAPTEKGDRLIGTRFDDEINALGGNDDLNGGSGDDKLLGNTGNDSLRGGTGDDKLIGGAGRDKLTGHAGNDSLVGGLGADRMTGGANGDVFVFTDFRDSRPGTARDVITDFGRGVDKINLVRIDGDPLRDGNQHLEFIGRNAFDGDGGQVRFDAAHHRLLVDLTGNGRPEMEIALAHVSHFSADDLIL